VQFATLTALEHLDTYSTAMSGTLPTQLMASSSMALTKLDIHSTAMSGTLPQNIGAKLQTLDLRI